MSNSDFEFEFSLEVLNHLGRGLYRNFATVVAEAISNSWDAEASEVRITIDRSKELMYIQDNGKGMNEADFRKKFLKVGYSRRDDKSNISSRKVLGRKGIGKLAMLSISHKVTVVSKKDGKITGGVIDNDHLDREIEQDGKYRLVALNQEDISVLEKIDSSSGTYIKFEKIKENVNNAEIIKKYLAVLFNFSLSSADEVFEIFVNGEKVSTDNLHELNKNTEFLWQFGGFKDTQRFQNLKENPMDIEFDKGIKGYIASASKPSDLKIRGAGDDFKAGVHLFVNGRLRQEDVFKDIPSHQVVESYLYGEIHVDYFDDMGKDGNDIFTSSREGVVKDDPKYKEFLETSKKVRESIFGEWNKLRAKHKVAKIVKDSYFKDLKPEAQFALKKFLKISNDDLLDEKKRKQAAFTFAPARTKKKILISHTSKDKKLADKVYYSLLQYGFKKKDIIYTSSKHKDSRLPVGEDIFEYLRKFFVQSWWKNPHTIFVVSKKMEKEWFAVLEAGAAWVTQTNHTLFVVDNYRPKKPLNIEHKFVGFTWAGKYSDPIDAEEIFKKLAKEYQVNGTSNNTP